jgi:hypothetical protein
MPSLYADPDTVATFNKPEAHHPNLIGLSGYSRSGKDSVAEILNTLYGHQRVAFADKLRELALGIDPNIVVTQDEYGHLQDLRPYPGQYYVARLSHLVNYLGWEQAKKFREVRKTLQNVGNQAREVFGEDVWVKAAFSTLDRGAQYVVSDVRYKNEAREILHRGGIVLRVTRPGVGPANDHISEHDLADWAFDGYIENDGSLLDLQGTVMIALGDLG